MLGWSPSPQNRDRKIVPTQPKPTAPPSPNTTAGARQPGIGSDANDAAFQNPRREEPREARRLERRSSSQRRPVRSGASFDGLEARGGAWKLRSDVTAKPPCRLAISGFALDVCLRMDGERSGGSELQFYGEPFGGEGEGFEDVEALLSGRRDHRTQAREVFGALEGSESAGDFDLHFHHPQILLGEVVGEGNGEVDEEPEGRLLEGLEPDEEIVSGPQLLALFRALRGVEGRQAPVKREAFPDGGPIAVLERLDGLGGERRGALGLGRLHGLVGVEQGGAQGLGPGLLVELADRLKLAQEMGVAEGVKDVFEGVVGAPVVVDHDAALELGHGRAGLAAAPNRSCRICAVRSSGTSCWALR